MGCLRSGHQVHTHHVVTYPNKHEMLTSVGLMLGQRRRPWPNIKSTLDQRLVFAGIRVLFFRNQRCFHSEYVIIQPHCVIKVPTYITHSRT